MTASWLQWDDVEEEGNNGFFGFSRFFRQKSPPPPTAHGRGAVCGSERTNETSLSVLEGFFFCSIFSKSICMEKKKTLPSSPSCFFSCLFLCQFHFSSFAWSISHFLSPPTFFLSSVESVVFLLLSQSVEMKVLEQKIIYYVAFLSVGPGDRPTDEKEGGGGIVRERRGKEGGHEHIYREACNNNTSPL